MNLLVLSLLLAMPPDTSEWRFVDEPSRDGRSMLTFRTVELAAAPATPLAKDEKPPAGSKFGSVRIGPGGERRLGVVWHAASGTLWFDADGDGRFSPAERHALGDKPIEAKVKVPVGDGPKREHTVLIRKRLDGVAWAVRGYTTGSVVVNGKQVAAILADGDADGCFDGAGADRVWLDLDGDGKFDPLTEQFPLGTAITAGGTAVLIRPRPDGLAAEARVRPNETGSLRVEVALRPKATVAEFAANYVSEYGELVVVKDVDKPVTLPAGKYRIDSLRLKLVDGDGKVWQYTFSAGERTYGVEVAKGKQAIHKPVDGLRITISFDSATVAPGESMFVSPNIVAGPMWLTQCEVGDRYAQYGREVPAEIRLTEAGSEAVDRCETGFM